jgi:hypothetical protein
MTHYPSILDEGYGGAANEEYALQALPPAERRRIKKERRDRRDKWEKAHAARAEWTPEMFAAEEARLRDQIENWGRHERAA